ncbi:MAG: HEAT repeat domain-containing protein [Myxococcota bacterium]
MNNYLCLHESSSAAADKTPADEANTSAATTTTTPIVAPVTRTEPSPKAKAITDGEFVGREESKALASAAAEAAAAGAVLSDARREAVLLMLGACVVSTKDGAIYPGCEDRKRYEEVTSADTERTPKARAAWAELAREHLTNPRAAVRLKSVELTRDMVGTLEPMRKDVLRAARQERHPFVLAKMVGALGAFSGRDDEIAALMMEVSHHEHPKVREAAVQVLAREWMKGTPNSLKRAMEMIREDPDIQVRKLGCRTIGARANEDPAFALLATYTEAPSKEPELYVDCLKGLVNSWAGSIAPKPASKRGYELTLAHLRKKPRTAQAPPRQLMTDLELITRPGLLRGADFVDRDEIRALVVDLMSDRESSWLGRSRLIELYVQLGATREDLLKLREGPYKGIKQDEKVHDIAFIRLLDQKIEAMR